jgi:hypothetical protein
MASLSLADFADTTAGIPFAQHVNQALSMSFQPNQYILPPQIYPANVAYPTQANIEGSLSFTQMRQAQVNQHESASPEEYYFCNTSFEKRLESAQPLADFFYEDPEDVHWTNTTNGPY